MAVVGLFRASGVRDDGSVSASAGDADRGVGNEVKRCVAETSGPPQWNRVTPILAGIIFFGLFVGVLIYFGNTSVYATLAATPQFGLFVALMAALAGLAGVSLLFSINWLVALTKVTTSLSLKSWVLLSLSILALGVLIFGFLIFGQALVPGDLVPILRSDAELTEATRPVTLSIAVLESPGLVGLLALRHVAISDATWEGSQRCSMLLLIRLRADLRRLLALLGGALTLLVIATGMRRRALLAFDPTLPIPKEQVLMYGLIFASLLGVLFLTATTAIDARAATIVNDLEPYPDPEGNTFAEQVKRRTDLGSAMGTASSFASFQSAVVIAAPLLTALIGISTGP